MPIVFVCSLCKTETNLDHMLEHWFSDLARNSKGFWIKAIYIPEVGKTIKAKLTYEQFEEMWLHLNQPKIKPRMTSPYMSRRQWNGN